MRLIMLLLTTAIIQVSASTYGQNVTLKEDKASLKKVLTEIGKQTGYDFFYNQNMINTAKPVSVDLKNVSLEAALEICFKNQPLTYSIENKFVTLKPKAPTFLERLADRWAAVDVRGVVRNERGEALEGITVMVKGGKTGTRTNAKGEFVLKGVKKGDVLVFTGVAIEPFEYTVKDDKNIDLNLKARLVQLEEVGINTGYQKVSKERYVGSYAQLDSAAFHRRTGMGILERLDGTVTGVLFNKKLSEGANANESPIQIRGLSTLNSNQNPLIIVDNFPYNFNLNTINPNDVENVVVLRDAAATSIWGAKAGNGVIVITTKKAKYNRALNVSVNSNANIENKPDLFQYPMISSSEFIDLEQFLFSKGAYNRVLNDRNAPSVSPVVDILNKIRNGSLSEIQGQTEIDKFRNIDYRDQLNKYVYQRKISQQHYLNLNGGSEFINYQLSVGYNHIKSNIQNSKGDSQYTVSSTAGFKVGKKIEISAGFNFNQGDQRSINFPSFPSYPYISLADEKGNALAVPKNYRLSYLDTVGRGQFMDWHFRPLDEVKLADQKTLTQTFGFNADLNYSITSWLKLNLQGQYTINANEGSNLQSMATYDTRDLINRFTNLTFQDAQSRYPLPMGDILYLTYGKDLNYNFRSKVLIDKQWKNHLFNAMIAGDISERKITGNSSGFYGYQSDFLGYSTSIDYFKYYRDISGFSSRIPNPNSLGDKMTTCMVSLTANASYTYNNKYTLYASARRDGSNLFGTTTNNKWKPLWSAGAAWQISKESFFNTNWIENLSLKASYGYSGNVNNSLAALLTISYSPTPDYDSGLKFSSINNPPNPDLRWEEVRNLNIGMNFSLLKGKINGNVEYFRKNAVDLIGNIPFSASSGIESRTVNGSSLKGAGFNLDLSALLLNRGFKWQVNYGLSQAKTKVVKVYQPYKYQALDFLVFAINPAVNRLAYGLSSYRWAGLDPQTGDPQGYLDGEVSKDYFSIMRDSVDNQVFHGSAIPIYTGFLTNTFSWKNLSLTFNITYNFDFYFRRPALTYSSLAGQRNISADFSNRWQKPGDEKHTNIPSFIYPSSNVNRDDFYTYSEINVLRGDHVRLQDATLKYDFQSIQKYLTFIKKIGMSVYINNLNLMLWKKDKSKFDPNFAGANTLVSPPSKTIAIGFNANF